MFNAYATAGNSSKAYCRRGCGQLAAPRSLLIESPGWATWTPQRRPMPSGRQFFLVAIHMRHMASRNQVGGKQGYCCCSWVPGTKGGSSPARPKGDAPRLACKRRRSLQATRRVGLEPLGRRVERQPPAPACGTCTMMARRSESLAMLSPHFLQEARPLLAYSARYSFSAGSAMTTPPPPTESFALRLGWMRRWQQSAVLARSTGRIAAKPAPWLLKGERRTIDPQPNRAQLSFDQRSIS